MTAPRVRYFAVAQSGDSGNEIVAVTDSDDGASVLSLRETEPGAGTWSAPVSHGAPTETGLAFVNTGGSLQKNAHEGLSYALVDSTFNVWQIFQTGPGGDWSPWESLGRPPTSFINSGPVLSPNLDGRLQVFVIAGGPEIWTRRQTAPGAPTWTDWASIGGPRDVHSYSTAEPAIVQNGFLLLEVFFVAQGQVWHSWQTGADDDDWSHWASLGSPGHGDIGDLHVVQDQQCNLRVLATLGGRLWHIRQLGVGSPSWGHWEALEAEPGRRFHGIGLHQYREPRLIVVSVERLADGGTQLVTWEDDRPGGSLRGGRPINELLKSPIGSPLVRDLSNPQALWAGDGRVRLVAQVADFGLYHVTEVAPDGREWLDGFQRLTSSE